MSKEKKIKHVAVLKGGMSREREVSLSSGKGVAKALKQVGYQVTEIDVGHDVSKKLCEIKPDVAFIALHGPYGEDGCIQGMLEIMRIPYTHSGVAASAVAMNKPLAKVLMEAAGIPTPPGKVMTAKKLGELSRAKKLPMPKPFVVKPLNDGSSVGVLIVREKDKFMFNEKDWTFGPDALVEKFIPGRELSVAVLGDRALGIIEIVPKVNFYDYKAKYTVGKAEHLLPAPIHKKAYKQIQEYAVMAHKALGCRGVSRLDLRYDDTRGEPGKIYVLEVNTHPGMTPLSLTPEMAAHEAISYEELVDYLVKNATLENKSIRK